MTQRYHAGPQWEARRQEIYECILHEGWLLQDVAEFYHITPERARQVVRALGIPFSLAKVVQLWCPWAPPIRPCVDCGQLTYPGQRTRERCRRCYSKWIYRHNPERRAKQRVLMERWKKENPLNYHDIANRATRNYRRRHREQGLCDSCSRPAVPGRLQCEQHLQRQRDKYWQQRLDDTLTGE